MTEMQQQRGTTRAGTRADPRPQGTSADAEASATGPPVVSTVSLLAGRREVIIRHGDEDYRLRITGNNKLILTK